MLHVGARQRHFRRVLNPRAVIPLQQPREAVKAGEEDALGDVRLIELVAHFPLQLRGMMTRRNIGG
jgi:hypothetical protein